MLLALLVCAALLSTCKDNPVIVANKQLDSARYNWKIDEIYADIMSAWALDTNNIFFLDIYNKDLIKYNGHEYLRYNYTFDFSAWCMNGVSDNEVYLGGYDNRMPEPTFGKPQLRCWNGAGYKIIDIPDNFEYYSYVSTIFTGVHGQIWIGTNRGRVLKLQNGNAEETYIDTSQYIRSFLIDETNNLCFLAVRDSCNPNRTYCKVFISIFSYETSNWQRVFYKEYEDPQIALIPQNLGNEIYASDYCVFYKFTGTGYIKKVNVYGFLASPVDWSGISSSDIMCMGSKTGGSGLCGYIFHWNGNTWSDENIQLAYCSHTIINVQGKYICTASDTYYPFAFVYYGTKK